MDQVLIGKFIAAERKQLGLTQRQLAEELGISDKTISKWETGNGFPEASLLLPLCDRLGITVNELLSAKRLTENEYQRNAEVNMVNMIREKDENRRNYLLTIVTGGTASVTFVVLLLLVVVYHREMPAAVTGILAVLAIGVFAAGLYVATKGESSIGYFQCPKCGECFVPSYGEYLKGPHIGPVRRFECPHCHQRVWAKKVMGREKPD